MTVKAYGLKSLRINTDEPIARLDIMRAIHRADTWIVAMLDTRNCVETYISTQELESLGHWALAAARAPLDDGLDEIRRYGT